MDRTRARTELGWASRHDSGPSAEQRRRKAARLAEHPDNTEIESTWHEFHRVVNMTSEELSDWLRTRSAGEDAEQLPDAAGPALGRHVLAILGKRKGDLTEDDIRIMRRVIDTVHSQRGADLEPTAGEPHWRYRLMSIGHDPLKPLPPGRRSSSTR